MPGIEPPKTLNKRSLARNSIEMHLADRVRELRTLANVSQIWLADELKLTTQQIQNYETGRTRIPAARLWEIAAALKVDLEWFFSSRPPSADWLTPGEIELAKILRVLPPERIKGLLKEAEDGVAAENEPETAETASEDGSRSE